MRAPFSVVLRSDVPENTVLFIPKIDGMVVDLKEGFKIQQRDSKGNITYRELTNDEKKRFGMITNIGARPA